MAVRSVDSVGHHAFLGARAYARRARKKRLEGRCGVAGSVSMGSAVLHGAAWIFGFQFWRPMARVGSVRSLCRKMERESKSSVLVE